MTHITVWSAMLSRVFVLLRGKAWRSVGGSNGMYYGRYFSNQVVVGEKVSQTLGTLGI